MKDPKEKDAPLDDNRRELKRTFEMLMTFGWYQPDDGSCALRHPADPEQFIW